MKKTMILITVLVTLALLNSGCGTTHLNYTPIVIKDAPESQVGLKHLKIADIKDGRLKVDVTLPIQPGTKCQFIIEFKPDKINGASDDADSPYRKYKLHGTFLMGEKAGSNMFIQRRTHFDTSELTYTCWRDGDNTMNGFTIHFLKKEFKQLPIEKPGNRYLLELSLTEYPDKPLSLWVCYE